jgi:hypothetical protein
MYVFNDRGLHGAITERADQRQDQLPDATAALVMHRYANQEIGVAPGQVAAGPGRLAEATALDLTTVVPGLTDHDPQHLPPRAEKH